MAEGWTQLCKYFLNGHCRDGRFCRFSHFVPSRNLLPERPTRICHFFQRGSCRFGKNCWWSHNDPGSAVRARSNAPDERQKQSPRGSSGSARDGDVSGSETSTSLSGSPERREASNSRNHTRLNENRARNAAPSTSIERKNGIRNLAQGVGHHIASASGSNNGPVALSQDVLDDKCCDGRNCRCVNRGKCSFRNRTVFGRGKHKAEDSRMKKPIMPSISKWKDKVCGVCMEVIMEKSDEERRFGILPNCNHCFCLTCIRKWRQAKHFENEVIRACPECRVTSDYVCPSRVWFETNEEKEKLLEDYKNVLSTKNCKYFSKDRKCPFGNKCFYLHALPDGTKVDLGPPKRHPRYLRDLEHIIMFEFLEENGLLLDMDIDIPMFLTSDSDDDDSDREETLALIDFFVD